MIVRLGLPLAVIASEAKQSRMTRQDGTGLLHRFALRNDEDDSTIIGLTP
jgi:hypothetical protein